MPLSKATARYKVQRSSPGRSASDLVWQPKAHPAKTKGQWSMRHFFWYSHGGRRDAKEWSALHGRPQVPQRGVEAVSYHGGGVPNPIMPSMT